MLKSQLIASVEAVTREVRYSGDLSIWFILLDDGSFCISRLIQDEGAWRQLDLNAVLENATRLDIDFEPGEKDGDDKTCEMQVNFRIRKGKVADLIKTNVVFHC